MTDHWTWPDSKDTQSDSEYGDGVAVWEEIPLDEYSITVEHPDYQTRTYAPDYLRDDEEEGMYLDESGRQPILHLTPDTQPRYETIIRVEDTSGNSISGASVTINNTTQTTSGTGRATFDLPEGTHTVEVSADDYHDTSEDIQVASTTDGDTFSITLEEIEVSRRVYPADVAPIRAFAVGYWPLDEDVRGAEQLNGLPTRLSGGTFGHAGIDNRSTAYDAGDASTANTIIAEGIDSEVDFDPYSTWTISIWLNARSASSYQVAAALEDPDSQEYIGVGLWNDGSIKCYSAGHTPGEGSIVSTNEWHHVALSWDGSECHVWLNGNLDYSVTPDSLDWLRNPTDFTLGTRRYASSGEVDGYLDQAILFDAALSSEQINALAGVQDSLLPGSPDATTDPGTAVVLETSADIPAGGTITVTAYEDVSGSEAVGQQTVTIEDGHRLYGLPNLLGDEESSYWLETEWSTTVGGQTPHLRQRQLGVPTTEVLDYLEFRHPETSEILEIPVHDPSSLSWAPFQARRTPDSDVGAFRLVEPEGNPLQIRDPETGDIYGIDWSGTGEVVEPPTSEDGYGYGGFGEGGYGGSAGYQSGGYQEGGYGE